MTAKEIRDIGFLSWKDPDAWMESMSGPRWDALVAEENASLKAEIEANVQQKQINTFKEEITKAQGHYDLESFESGPIRITPLGTFSIKWRFATDQNYVYARDACSDGTHVVYTHDIGKGSEKYELVCLDAKTRKVCFRRSPVGPTVSLEKNRIYYLGVQKKLWYNELYTCDATTGNNTRSLYKEDDPHYNLFLNRQTYLIRENAGKTDAYYITSNNTLVPLKPGSERQHPFNNTCYYRKAGSDTYENLPKGVEGTPFAVNKHYILTHIHGETCVYNHSGTIVLHIKQGTIQLNDYDVNSTTLRVDDGTCPPYIFDETNKQSPAFKLKAKKITATSSDGTAVHGVILYKGIFTKPKALFAAGYGAYGVPCSPAACYEKWTPLIERGWGILYTYIRGGGDDSDAWAQAGRLEGRTHTRDDFLALVESAQKTFKISAKYTVIYGRSAGGFLMGMCLDKEPTGRLFGAVYTEVPYVDILRTTTNQDLPLTQMEYNEFGDPGHRLEDFKFLVDLSPADVAITTEAPNVFVLARTGLNDSEVYAYEPVKWIRRLRKTGDKEKKIIGIAIDEGHFYSGSAAIQAKAEDFSLLHNRIFNTPPLA